ncbi:MAG: C13 family peptidase [Pseudomonadota bacterium]
MIGEAAPQPRASLNGWVQQGARSLVFMRPRWHGLQPTPAIVALLVLLELALSIGLGRTYIDGEASFQWRAALSGWGSFALLAWACFALRRAPRDNSVTAPGALHLLTLLLAQGLCLTFVCGMAYMILIRTDWFVQGGDWMRWTAWIYPAAWATLAQLVVMLRSGDRKAGARVLAILAVAVSCTLTYIVAPNPPFWREEAVAEEGEQDEALRFNQEVVEQQAPLLEEKLAALKPQRPGIADMYTITFAPYQSESVFKRESGMVSEVMAKRFDAAGRGLQLLNHRDDVDDMVWATPLNLQRAIEGVAQTMDRDEDVLFIHLTSHGASNGELAADFWPLDVEPVTPPALRKWLDDAGIKHRVISISACYAGNWIAPLANDDTLVMTASDAAHTSYGCGKKSPLTFFGRAMYDEQLRATTLSFEEAHAAARKIIDQREKAAGKDDGYSNPQIKVGNAIRPYLENMKARLEGR